MLCIFLNGISSGLPLLLIGSTLKAWMRESNVDLTVIGLFAFVGIPYTFKFLWSPLMDRFTPPFLGFLGRRRGWILSCQAMLAFLLSLLAIEDPARFPLWVAILSLAVAFVSASQDIAIDAYRRDILSDEELGLGSSLAVNGYLVGMFIAGALALTLADHMAWRWVYMVMSGLLVLSMGVTLLSPDADKGISSPATLAEAVVMPFVEFIRRQHAFEILLFVLLYKLGDSMASDMFVPFYIDLHFTKTQIAAVSKVVGFWGTMAGGFLGGLGMVRLGIPGSLWIFGLLQTGSTFGFSALASLGHSLSALTCVVLLEALATGMARSAYIGFMASLCDRRFTATQYALISSVAGVPRVILGASSGYFAKTLGWHAYFLFCTLLHLPGMLLLLRQRKWFKT